MHVLPLAMSLLHGAAQPLLCCCAACVTAISITWRDQGTAAARLPCTLALLRNGSSPLLPLISSSLSLLPLQFLVALQAALTVVGNCTCWAAAYRIYQWSQQREGGAA